MSRYCKDKNAFLHELIPPGFRSSNQEYIRKAFAGSQIGNFGNFVFKYIHFIYLSNFI